MKRRLGLTAIVQGRDALRDAMELNQLRAFVAVLDAGSVVHASKALRISRTTLQARINGLEQSLGVELLVRTHRGVHPTEFGRRFTERARALMRDADALARAAVREREELIGQLSLRVSVGLPPQLIAMLMREIGERHPDLSLRVDVTNDPAREIPDEVDVVLHFGPAIPAGPFRTFAIGRFPEHLIASTRYLDEHGRPQQLDDLAEHRLSSWCSPGEDGTRLPLREGGTIEITPDVVSNQVYVLHLLAANGHGISFVPDDPRVRATVGPQPREIVLPELVGRETGLWVLLPEAQADTPRSRAAAKLLHDAGKGLVCLHR